MATHEHGDRPAVAGLVTTARVLSVLLFTTVELVVLALWSTMLLRTTPASGTVTFAVGLLVAGQGIEYVLRDVTINGIDLAAPPWSIVVLSVSEGLIWVAWLSVVEYATRPGGLVLAATVFVVLLIPQHTVEDNALRGEALFGRLLDVGTAGFTVVKATGATIWLALVIGPEYLAGFVALADLPGTDPVGVGFAVLTVTLFVEHTISVRYSRVRRG